MHYLISLSYDGSKFYGFQRLKNYNTVQKNLEEALTIINKKEVKIKGAGRTDRGVHALDQKATFDLDVNITPEKLLLALNSLVRPNINITSVSVVPESFHARFNTVQKEYIYKINLGEFNPFYENYMYQPTHKLNLKAMKKCANLFVGIHDFTNFVGGTRPNSKCIIYNITFKKKHNILEIKFVGKSFYRYMIRNLVGAMLDVSNNKCTLEDIKNALNNPQVKKQFKTAVPNGLYLTKISYK